MTSTEEDAEMEIGVEDVNQMSVPMKWRHWDWKDNKSNSDRDPAWPWET